MTALEKILKHCDHILCSKCDCPCDHLKPIIRELCEIVESQQKALEFYRSDEFPWSADSEYDNGAMADETTDSTNARLSRLADSEGV